MPEILKRHSAESFAPGEVSLEALNRILEAGRLAPSAKNRQPWRLILIRQTGLKERLQDICYGDALVGSAGAVIALCTTNIDYKMPNGHLSYPYDLGICAAFMTLQAQHEGLGSCLYTTYREDEIRELLSVPYSMKVPLLLLLGRLSDKGSISPAQRLPAGRIISHEHW